MHADVLIVGAGAAGSALALGLAPTGCRIVLLERGHVLPREAANWDPERVFGPEQRYCTEELWRDGASGTPFRASMYYCVGGNTKVYGAALLRLRPRDFEATPTLDGLSPAWPIAYEDLAPYYDRAEALYHVHGRRGADPFEPPASGDFPHPPLPHEPRIQRLRDQLRARGLQAFELPMGVRLNPEDDDAGPFLLREVFAAARRETFDGFPDLLGLKADAETATLRPALAHPNVTLRTGTRVRRVLARGREVTGVEAEIDGAVETFTANVVVLAAGAINTAALLLRSASDEHPHGLANGSGCVGRHLMRHVTSKFYAVCPSEPNDAFFQKTLAVNDFYAEGPDGTPAPGHAHLMGKHDAHMIARDLAIGPEDAVSIASHSVDWWVQTEDLPLPESRVDVDANGSVVLHYRETNRRAHERLMDLLEEALRPLGFTAFHRVPMPLRVMNHQCGTCRMGTDPAASVVNPTGRAHDLANLYVADASVFPSSGATNPTLTVVAHALRVADHLAEEVL